MATSDARIAANRLNCLKSTGPKTAEGKAVARLNAFQHGMAGQGDILKPGEDQAVIAARAARVAHDLGAAGEVGLFMAHRAATLMSRVELAAERTASMTAANMATAAAQFDADLAGDIAEWSEKLVGPDPRVAIEALENWPDGVAYLIRAWTDLRDQLESKDFVTSAQAEYRVREWLAPGDEATPMLERIEAEVQRLTELRGSMTESTTAIAQARRAVVLRASFDATPEANLCRRHELAAERGIYRAVQTIAAMNRRRPNPEPEIPTATSALVIPAEPAPTPPSLMSPVPPLPKLTTNCALASFRVGLPAVASTPAHSNPRPSPAPMTRDDRRKMQKKIAAASR